MPVITRVHSNFTHSRLNMLAFSLLASLCDSGTVTVSPNTLPAVNSPHSSVGLRMSTDSGILAQVTVLRNCPLVQTPFSMHKDILKKDDLPRSHNV